MTYPSDHFPETPPWVQAAVLEAIERAGVTAAKWQVPLEAIARYESNANPAANLCTADLSLPVGMMQQGRAFYRDAKEQDPAAHAGLGTFADPVRSVLMAVMHIDSRLSVSGGYGGIGTPAGKVGLLPRTDRGPGGVLRAWIADPAGFDVESARSLYRGY